MEPVAGRSPSKIAIGAHASRIDVLQRVIWPLISSPPTVFGLLYKGSPHETEKIVRQEPSEWPLVAHNSPFPPPHCLALSSWSIP